MKNLPGSETLAVFLGVTGFDWLVNGHADLPSALAIALLAGLAIYTLRRPLEKFRNNRRQRGSSTPPAQ